MHSSLRTYLAMARHEFASSIDEDRSAVESPAVLLYNTNREIQLMLCCDLREAVKLGRWDGDRRLVVPGEPLPTFASLRAYYIEQLR